VAKKSNQHIPEDAQRVLYGREKLQHHQETDAGVHARCQSQSRSLLNTQVILFHMKANGAISGIRDRDKMPSDWEYNELCRERDKLKVENAELRTLAKALERITIAYRMGRHPGEKAIGDTERLRHLLK